MDLLLQPKEPVKKTELKKGFVSKNVEPTNENNERLLEFLNILNGKNKRPSQTPSDLTIQKAQKTGRQITLIMHDKETIKQYMGVYKPMVFNTNNTDIIDNFEVIKTKIKKSKKSKKIENGVAAEDTDEHDEILNKYAYYNNDEQHMFKLDLTQTFISNDKIAFLNDIKQKMNGLQLLVDEDDCDSQGSSNTEYSPFIHQMIVKQYLNSFSPYRGLLLYHGLGSGKTCSSIGIIESMKFNKEKIFIMTPASLQKNYKTQMKTCGNQLFRNNNHWVFQKFPTEPNKKKSFIFQVYKRTHLPIYYLNKQNGVFLIDKSKPNQSNYNDLSSSARQKLNEQIDLMINNKFEFINYNGINKRKWNEYSKDSTINPFNNTTIVIDEGHNFVSRIVNKLNIKKTTVSTIMYENIMSAENCNVVILSGTPLINYPCELGVMFNLIGGYNKCLEMELNHQNKNFMTKKYFIKLFRQNKSIDVIDYFPNTNLLRITLNPYGFIRNNDGTIVFDGELQNKNFDDIKKEIKELIKEHGYSSVEKSKDIKIKTIYYKKFPDTEQEFNKIFVSSKNNLNNKLYFQKKIVGMVSYLGDKKSLMPNIIVPEVKSNLYDNEDMFIVPIKINNFVLKEYKEARHRETEIDKNIMKKAANKGKDTYTSSYRVFSRSTCNFAFPTDQDIKRPLPNAPDNKINEGDLDDIKPDEMLTHIDGEYDESDLDVQKPYANAYRKKIVDVLNEFTNNPHKYFESRLNKLAIKDQHTENMLDEYHNNLEKYSPKMFKILENLMDQENIGLHLLYSNFRNLGGIAIFTRIMDYYGYTQFKVVKKNGIWNLDLKHPYYTDNEFMHSRKYYALYTGEESSEEKEIIRNIYNGNFDKLDRQLFNDIYAEFHDKMKVDYQPESGMNNNFGQIIQCLIISSSGAEGIDLKNVRHVHIMEPYWHPVRISQVIGRARRICSHKNLPEEYRNVKIYMYLLSFDNDMLNKMSEKQKDEAGYTSLYHTDAHTNGGIISTDERLYLIMLRKKQLMGEFLDAIKESSIDCVVNYEDKSKCLSFPMVKDATKKQTTDINYKYDKITSIGDMKV